MNCILCRALITADNDSKEHLIPNAIGGRLTLSGVLCGKCNNNTGHLWDSDLARQLNSLSLLFETRRQRGDVPSQVFKTTSGEELKLKNDGSMTPARPIHQETSKADGTVQIHMTAETMPALRVRLMGLKRKFPALDIEALLTQATAEAEYPKGMLHFPLRLGGPHAGRSIVKSALALAATNGVDAEACVDAREYLIGTANAGPFGYFYSRDLVIGRPPGVPLHCVAVSNRGAGGQLLAYVELYGALRVVIRLANAYTGADVHVAYALDPTTGEKLNVDLDLALGRDDIAKAFAYEMAPPESIREAIGAVVAPALKRQNDRERSRVVAAAVDSAADIVGVADGSQPTEQQLKELTALVMEKIRPYLIHTMRRPRGPGEGESSDQ